MKQTITISGSTLSSSALPMVGLAENTQQKPNIVFVLADNLGYK